MKRMQGHGCWKASFSERKLLNAILRVSSSTWKMFLSHEMKCYLQCRRQIFVLELFCRASHVRASMHRINWLELLRTLKLCLMQLRKWRECKATDAESFFLSERKLLIAILRVTQVHERCFFLMKWNVICNAEDRFSCLELF